MDLTQGITKRLEFGDLSQQLNIAQPDVDDVIKALKNPSVPNFQTALRLLEEGCERRFHVIEDTAKEQSAGVGEADLRRMKRQFSSLKNTFLHYVVKDEFIAALADGLPNGTEDIQLAQFEEEAARTVERLRALKAANEGAQGEIGELIARITAAVDEIKAANAGAAAGMARLAREVEEAGAADAGMPPAPAPDGPDEDAAAAALAEEAAQARALEAQIAAQEADLADLEAVLPAERAEAELARAELADLQDQRAARAGEASAATSARFASSAAWAAEAAALLEGLGGVRVASAAAGGVLELALATAFPAAAVAGGSVGPCARGAHQLRLEVDAAAGGTVTAAALTPADVDVSDVVEAAGAGRRGPDFVVREVRARLAGVLHRRALAAEAAARFPGAAADAAGVAVTAPLRPAGGAPVTVQVAVEQSWPDGDDVVRVVAVSGEVAPARRAAAEAVRVEGRGVAAALDATLRILEASEAAA